jgi:uncharacterized CHY-type Zn-finger protein
MLKLSKRIPARTKTVEFLWCKKNWLKMSKAYREIRMKSRNPMDSCFWCGLEFKNGEMMALTHAKGKGNKVLCGTCTDELLESNA